MAKQGETIINTITGETLTFQKTAAMTGGELLAGGVGGAALGQAEDGAGEGEAGEGEAGEQRGAAGDEFAAFKGALARHCADLEAAALPRTQEEQLVHAVQVDQGGGLRQSEVHGWDKALPARQQLAVVAVLGQKVQRLRQAARCMI